MVVIWLTANTSVALSGTPAGTNFSIAAIPGAVTGILQQMLGEMGQL